MKSVFSYLPIVIILVFASVAMSQTNTSVVEGRVADPSGAVIRDSSVVLTSLRTSSALTTRTNDVMGHDLSPLHSHDILRCVRHIPV